MSLDRQMIVRVSPLVPRGWYDPISKIWFKPELGNITIPAGTNLTNINRYIRLNYLLDVTPKQEQTPRVEVRPVEYSTPGQLLAKSRKPVQKVEEPKVVEELPEEPQVETEETTMVEETEEEVVTVEIETEQPEKIPCQYCGKLYSPRGVKSHEKACKEKPAE